MEPELAPVAAPSVDQALRDEAARAALLAARFAAIVPADDILFGQRLKARHPGYCSHSLDAGVLIRPRDAAQLAAVCREAHGAGLPLVPHGGLTGLVDGTASRPGDLIVSFEKMNHVLSIDVDEGVVRVESGLTLQALDEALAPSGMMIGVDIASRGSCTIGGMIATNAGGAQVLRYGMMRHNVLGLEVVLADGTVLDLMRPLLKDNAGYDLKQLFIGSEGTLGLVCKAALRLWPRPAGACTALLACESHAQLMQLYAAARAELGHSLQAFEAMWPRYYELTTSQPTYGPRPLALGAAVYALIEVGSSTQEAAHKALLNFLEQALASGRLGDAAVAQSGAERDAFWRAREDSDAVEAAFEALLNYDIGLPLAGIGDFIETVEAAFRDRFPLATLFFFGHVGDRNLHIMIGIPQSALVHRLAMDALVYQVLARYNGSTLSAEHGIGLDKRNHLPQFISGPALALMQTMKCALDPKNILNPGKIFELEPPPSSRICGTPDPAR